MNVLAATATATTLVLLAPAAIAGSGAPHPTAEHAGASAAKARAKVFLERGIKAYRRHRYKDAIDAFLHAHRIYPSPTLSYDTARAYQKLHDHAGALEFYRAYLRQAPHASDRKRVERRIGKLEALLHKKGVQQVTVMSDPRGATVIIDGRPVGVTPWTGEIYPGQHHLRLRLEGYQSVRKDFELPDLTAIDVTETLAPRPAPKPAPAPAPAPVQAPTRPRPPATSQHDVVTHPGVRLPTWIALGAGVAALGGAAVFEGLRQSSEHSVKNDPTQVARAAAYKQMKSRQTTARVLAGTGGAAMVVGGILLYVDLSRSSSESTARLDLSCMPSGCDASLGGRW